MVFLQNAFFLNKFKYFENFSFSIFFKKIIFKALTRNIDKVILQSGLMAEIWKQSYPNIELIVLPIVPAIDCAKFQTNEKCYDFIYVATGHGYKNHTLLINAWINLARNGFFPRLCLVLRATSDAQLIKYIKNIAAENSLSIIILADLVHNDVLSVYGKSKCLIYPSLVESFGLPLVEASLLGLDIIASDLDYVFEVCSPTIVFNPDCLGSVVRAVCKYMGYKIIGNNYDYINGKDYIAKIIEGKR